MSALQSKKSGPLKGTSRIPGDKSISHRALMMGALTVGETIISGLLEGEDVMATAEALRQMGATIEKGGDGLWRVFGVGLGGLHQPEGILEVGNSGTSTRLLIGMVAGHNISASFNGDESLNKRPMKRVMIPLEMMGASFEATGGERLPLKMKGAADPLSIEYTLPVASAQVKSAIILAGLNASGTTTVIEKEPTRDHTENMLRHFGVNVKTEKLAGGGESISVTGLQELQPCAVDVPGDPSSAAFPAAAAILNQGSKIRLYNVGINDRRIGVYITWQEMGADIKFENQRIQAGEKVADIIVTGIGALKGIQVPESRVPSMIDEFPILAIVAAFAKGPTKMSGLGELRKKESDRLLMIAEGLKAIGTKVEMGEDWLIVHGTGLPPEGGATVKTALDHRIAMSFLVAGTATNKPVRVDDASPINTSFPNFVPLMNELNADIGP